MTRACRAAIIGSICWVLCVSAGAEQISVAVAANFAAPMKQIASLFERQSGHKVALSTGATGALFAQISNGAPFDVLLAADAQTPARLVRMGLALDASRFTYAVGKLVLWSAQKDLVDSAGDVLKRGGFRHLALAAPALAPYGAAAEQTLNRLGLLDKLRPKFVLGQSIGQAYSFVATGNAELGFVALSQVCENGVVRSGSFWIVPAKLHDALRQDAVLLLHGRDNPAARALLAFLKSPASKALLQAYGYASE